jgi:hypothetical protein
MALCGVVIIFLMFCFPENELIFVPINVPFSVEINKCTRPFLGLATCPYDKLIGVADVVNAMLDLLLGELANVTESAQRVRPLMISSLARGGKTTILSFLFDALKRDHNIRVIFITFNGSSNFHRRQGESQRDAILRVIATQLVDIGDSDPFNIQCDEDELDNYIGELPFVLLVDELNALSAPIDGDAGGMLRRLFLDKKNRYLVFTTHIPISLEPQASHYMTSLINPPSPRGCLTVPLPQCMDLVSLKKMSDQCEALTPAEVMLYGGIPSLIYSVKALGEMTPQERFEKKFPPRSNVDLKLLKLFVLSVVDGVRRIDIAMFDEFSVVPEDNKIRWPLFYIACILKTFEDDEATHAVRENCAALWTYSQTTESGKEWECVLNIAIIFRCLYQRYCGSDSPFSIVPIGIKPIIMCRALPHECRTYTSVLDFVTSVMSLFPCVLVLIPSYSKFPDVDGFVVYRADATTQPSIYGYQAKVSRSYPKRNCPEWMGKGFLLRGQSPVMGSLRNGWTYMSRNDVVSLLGYSLLPMYPASWPSYPSSDEFD